MSFPLVEEPPVASAGTRHTSRPCVISLITTKIWLLCCLQLSGAPPDSKTHLVRVGRRSGMHSQAPLPAGAARGGSAKNLCREKKFSRFQTRGTKTQIFTDFKLAKGHFGWKRMGRTFTVLPNRRWRSYRRAGKRRWRGMKGQNVLLVELQLPPEANKIVAH